MPRAARRSWRRIRRPFAVWLRGDIARCSLANWAARRGSCSRRSYHRRLGGAGRFRIGRAAWRIRRRGAVGWRSRSVIRVPRGDDVRQADAPRFRTLADLAGRRVGTSAPLSVRHPAARGAVAPFRVGPLRERCASYSDLALGHLTQWCRSRCWRSGRQAESRAGQRRFVGVGRYVGILAPEAAALRDNRLILKRAMRDGVLKRSSAMGAWNDDQPSLYADCSRAHRRNDTTGAQDAPVRSRVGVGRHAAFFPRSWAPLHHRCSCPLCRWPSLSDWRAARHWPRVRIPSVENRPDRLGGAHARPPLLLRSSFVLWPAVVVPLPAWWRPSWRRRELCRL